MNSPDTLYEFILRQLTVEAEVVPQADFSSLTFREKLAQSLAGNLAMRDMALAAEMAGVLGEIARDDGMVSAPEAWAEPAVGREWLIKARDILSHARAEGVIK